MRWRTALRYRLGAPKIQRMGPGRVVPGYDAATKCGIERFGAGFSPSGRPLRPAGPAQAVDACPRRSGPAPAWRRVSAWPGPAMAAAVKAEHFHPGRPGAGDAGKAVLDHDTALGRDAHLLRGKQEQIGCGLAVCHLATTRRCSARGVHRAPCVRGSTCMRGCEPLDATQTNCVTTSSTSWMPRIASRSGFECSETARPADRHDRPRAACGRVRFRSRDWPVLSRGRGSGLGHLLRCDRIAVPGQHVRMGRQEITSLSTSTPSQSKMMRSMGTRLRTSACRRRAERNRARAGDRPACSRACGRSPPGASRSLPR